MLDSVHAMATYETTLFRASVWVETETIHEFLLYAIVIYCIETVLVLVLFAITVIFIPVTVRKRAFHWNVRLFAFSLQ